MWVSFLAANLLDSLNKISPTPLACPGPSLFQVCLNFQIFKINLILQKCMGQSAKPTPHVARACSSRVARCYSLSKLPCQCMLINKAKKIAAPAKLKSASSAQMPQHYSIRNAPSAAPDLPQEIMEMIFEKCGPEVPVVNIHAMLMRNKHKNAARIQACFKGS